MPQIREYTTRVEPGGPVSPRRLTTEDISVGRGMATLGDALADTGKQLYNFAEEKSVFEASKTAAQAQAQWLEKFEGMKRAAPEGAKDFTKTFTDEFDTWKQETVNGADLMPRARQVLEQRLEGIKAHLSDNAVRFEAQAYGQKQKQDLQNIFSANDNIVRADPSQRDAVLKSEMALIESTPFWDNQSRGSVLNERRAALWDRALDGAVTNLETRDGVSPAQIDSMINELKNKNAGWQGNNSAPVYDNALTRLQKLKEHHTARKNSEMVIEFEDHMRQIEDTGVDRGKFSEAWIRANVPDGTQADRMVLRQEKARAAGAQVAFVRDAPLGDVVANLTALEEKYKTSSEPGRDRAALDSAKQALAFRIQRWKDDQVGYASSVSQVAKAAVDKYLQAPTPENVSQLVATMTTEQKRLDPNYPVKVVPSQEVAQAANVVGAIGSAPDGVSQATAYFQSKQAVWGKHWPSFVSELRAAKALDDSQYVAASMLDKPHVKYLAEDLMRASVAKQDDLVKMIPGDGAEKRARESAQSALQPLRQTLGRNMETYRAFENAVTKLVLYKGAQTGSDTSGEASKFAEKIVLDSYEFEGTYRIPKSENVAAIRDGVERAKRSVLGLDIVVPADPLGLRPEDTRRIYMSAILENAIPVTRGDDSGVLLIDETGRPVYHRVNGKIEPVSWSWSELRIVPEASPEQLPPAARKIQK